MTAHVHEQLAPAERARLGRRAQLLAGLSAAYNGGEAVVALLAGAAASSAALPDASVVGIVLATVRLAVMPFLSLAQRRTGRALHSSAEVSDSAQTMLCSWLSAVLLVGLLLNAVLGWGWADPVAGLVIAGVALEEGLDAWRGQRCCGTACG